MIINTRTRVQFRGVTCTASYDYYATATGCVMCRVTYTPIRKELCHLRGHKTVQLLNLAFVQQVNDSMMFLGLQLDMPEAAELFATLAASDLRADDCALEIADLLNA